MPNFPFEQVLPPLIAIGVSLAVLLVARRGLFKLLVKRAHAWSSNIDEAVLSLFRTPSFLWCFIGAIYMGLEFADIPPNYREPLITTIHVALILSFTVAVSNVSVALVRNSLSRSNSPAFSSGIVYGTVRFGIYTMGVLSILGKLGIAVAPLLTAFGVAGLAVGLAFKDTLENAFSGIFLLLDQAIVAGRFRDAGDGAEGHRARHRLAHE